jgi:site-specific DNA-methyltransferase (adenine-specific)
MKFSAIVGNPPYQELTGGGMNNGKFSKQAKPIFNLFVEQSLRVDAQYVSMIIPARWYNGGMGLSSFIEKMINDERLCKLFDYYNSKDCFPTVVIPGGLCYFLWDRDASGCCEITNVQGNDRDISERKLNQFDVFVRNNKAVSIINKVLGKSEEFLDSFVSALDTFGLPTNEHGHKTRKNNDLVLIHSATFNSQGRSYIEREKVKKNQDLIDKYKVKISRMIPQGGEVGIRPENGYRSISTPEILKKGEVDTFSYLNVGFFDTEQEAINFKKYLECKFTRYMLRTTFSGVNVSQSNFAFVPKMDYTKEWDDEKLYDYFELSDDERKMIDSTMRSMN